MIHDIKLEVSNRREIGSFTNMCKLNNTLSEKPMDKTLN